MYFARCAIDIIARRAPHIGALGVVLLTVACAATPRISQEELAAARDTVAKSPLLRQKVVADCATMIASGESSNLKFMADLARTPVAEFPRIACERITNAWVAGTISNELFQRIYTQTATPEENVLVGRVMMGLDTSQ